LTPE
jgi:hypothetical protein